MDVAHLVDAFIAWHGRHSAPKTVRFYAQRLKRFRAEYGAREFGSLTALEIDEYLFRAGEGMSNSTRRHNAVGLTSLQTFAVDQKLLPKEGKVFDKLEKPRMGRRERVPTADEIDRLLAHADPAFIRIYRALCQCGGRPGELCGAKIAEVDWQQRAIIRKEHKTARKTGVARVIPIGDKLEPLLRQAIGDRTDPEAPVFLNGRSRPWTPETLSSAHRRYRDKAGIDKEIVLYLARHRFGTELIRKGLDIKAVADLMGHSSITTTQRYIHRDVKELRGQQDLID